jgi:hypothetical protein
LDLVSPYIPFVDNKYFYVFAVLFLVHYFCCLCLHISYRISRALFYFALRALRILICFVFRALRALVYITLRTPIYIARRAYTTCCRFITSHLNRKSASTAKSPSSISPSAAASLPPLSLTFQYHDRFLGKAVRIPVMHHIQIAAPLMLVTSALRFARGRAATGARLQQPAPPVGCMLVELWPAQRARFMFGFTLKACDRASTVDASAIEHFRAASRWRTRILQHVMNSYAYKVQVQWLLRNNAELGLLTRAAANSWRLSGWMRASAAAQPAASLRHPLLTPSVQAAAAARVAGKCGVCVAAKKGDTSLVGDHVLADAKCVNKDKSGHDPLHARLKMAAQVLLYFGRFNSLSLAVDGLRSFGLLQMATSRFVDCLWRRKLT